MNIHRGLVQGEIRAECKSWCIKADSFHQHVEYGDDKDAAYKEAERLLLDFNVSNKLTVNDWYTPPLFPDRVHINLDPIHWVVVDADSVKRITRHRLYLQDKIVMAEDPDTLTSQRLTCLVLGVPAITPIDHLDGNVLNCMYLNLQAVELIRLSTRSSAGVKGITERIRKKGGMGEFRVHMKGPKKKDRPADYKPVRYSFYFRQDDFDSREHARTLAIQRRAGLS